MFNIIRLIFPVVLHLSLKLNIARRTLYPISLIISLVRYCVFVLWVMVSLAGCLSLTSFDQYQNLTDHHLKYLNQYDDDWQQKWETTAQQLYRQTHSANGHSKKTPGFIVHLGDSMTYASPYGWVSEFGVAGLTDTLIWSKSQGGQPDAPDNKNGWQLARYDHPAGHRSYTAVSGIRIDQYLSGGHQQFAAGQCDQAPIKTLLNNFSVEPLRLCHEGHKVAVIADSLAAVILLGSNDIAAGRTPEGIARDLSVMIDLLMDKHIIPILSTIPPRVDYEDTVTATNILIRRLAQEKALPLIGFYEEILRRQPSPHWFGTLISNDGIHPSAGEYQDPSHYPGILNTSGYTLRGYLTLLKLHELKAALLR